MNEYLISVDNYKKPKVVSGNKGNYYFILRLMIMEVGTNPLFPLMGLGLRRRCRFITEDEIPDIQIELNKQIETYLPDLMITNISMEMDNGTLRITISSDEEQYNYSSDDFDLDLNNLVEESV